jgi:ADP-heptose:LPS heptosyltransferase
MALPALWAIRENFPGARLTLLSETPRDSRHLGPENVLPEEGLIDEFAQFESPAASGNIISTVRCLRQIRSRRFDALFYLVPELRVPLRRRRDLFFFRLAGLKQVFGQAGFRPIDQKTPGQPLPGVMNEADALLARLRLSGLRVPAAGKGCMDLRITSGERTRAKEWMRRASGAVPARGSWFAVGPGSKMPSKIWPAEYYQAVGRRLLDEFGLTPVIFGGPEDRATGEALIHSWKKGYCAAGALSVRESAAAMEDALFYLGNDTGTMHLAAAVGVPCVAVFSAQDWPGRWNPYGAGHQVLRLSVPCEGCKLEICNRKLECLSQISPETVFECCSVVIRGASGRRGGRPVELSPK